MAKKQKLRIFNDATAIVTGGASGFGRAVAEGLAKRGSEVVILDLQKEAAEETASKINSKNGKATAIQADATDFPQVQRIVDETCERTGRIDYIFNIAGIVISGQAHQLGIEDWNKIIGINFCGVVNGVQAAYPIMVKQGFGHIVNMSSIAGLLPLPGAVAYTATKHAVVGLSKALRIEGAIHGIRVSVLCPGALRTPLLMENGGKFGQVKLGISSEEMTEIAEKLRPMPPEQYAEKVLNAVARNKAIFTGRPDWQFGYQLNRFYPIFSMTVSRLFFKNALKKAGLLH
ncbi:MAG: SDR family oxidoreductase [Proteobacteria bacterium]|nr:SDR family oxidoreductase [Pseudomonadota bacterium]